MPGIQPSSRKQVRWAFTAEAQGLLRAPSTTPWTSPEAKSQHSIAREWAHRWKCWEWDEKARGKMPADCKSALELLDTVRREHPTWKVPAGVTRPAPRPTVVPIRPSRGPVRAPEAPPVRIAAGQPAARRRLKAVEALAGKKRPKAEPSDEHFSKLHKALKVMRIRGMPIGNKIHSLLQNGFPQSIIDEALDISAGARPSPFDESLDQPAARRRERASRRPPPRARIVKTGSPEKAHKPSKPRAPGRQSNVMTADDLIREAMKKYA